MLRPCRFADWKELEPLGCFADHFPRSARAIKAYLALVRLHPCLDLYVWALEGERLPLALIRFLRDSDHPEQVCFSIIATRPGMSEPSLSELLPSIFELYPMAETLIYLPAFSLIQTGTAVQVFDRLSYQGFAEWIEPFPLGDLYCRSNEAGTALCQVCFLRKDAPVPKEALTLWKHCAGAGSLLYEPLSEEVFQRIKTLASVRARDLIQAVSQELSEYWKGERESFDIPLELYGASPFCRAVWQTLSELPSGSLLSYEELAAKALGKNDKEARRYARAVGVALSKNPIKLLIPCHRVLGSEGQLTGYSDGLDLKADLLNFELLNYRGAVGDRRSGDFVINEVS